MNLPDDRAPKPKFNLTSRHLWFGYFLLHLIWAGVTWYMLISHSFFPWDFIHYYECGTLAASANRFQIYDPAVQEAVGNQIISPLRLESFSYIQYVPFVFPLMVPLTVLPWGQSFAAWVVVTMIVGVGGMVLLLKSVGTFSWQRLIVLLIATCASYGCWQWLRLGQYTWLLIGFYAVFFVGVLNKRDIWGGIALALTTAKPQYTIFFLPGLALTKRFKLLAAFAAAEAALLVLAGVVVGWSNVINYPSILMHADTTGNYFGVWPKSMVSFRGLFSWTLPDQAVMPAVLGALALGLLWITALWWKVRTQQNLGNLCFALAITIIAALVFSPHAHIYDCTLLSLCVALTFGAHARQWFGPWYRIWWTVLILYPLASWVVFLIFNQPTEGNQTHTLFSLAVNLFLMIAGSIVLLRTSGDKSANIN
jgi:hypothetical protein